MAASIRNTIFAGVFSYTRILNLQKSIQSVSLPKCSLSASIASIHTTSIERSKLMQFFDDPKNFGATEVKSGRSWTLDELRIKSSEDLHKLWYVLLKERNMLLTMEHNLKVDCHLFPSPERLDKVQDSMARLEQVVHERNNAYWLLEIGEEAPKPKTEKVLDPEDPLAHIRDAVAAVTQVKDSATVKFLRLIREKERKLQQRKINLQNREAMMLLKKFPNLDKEALQAKYPDIDIEKLKYNKKTLGMHEFNTA